MTETKELLKKHKILLSGKPEYEIMQTAWRERNPGARIKAAKEAIGLNPECATAYILLAEEEVPGDILRLTTSKFRKWISMINMFFF